MNQNNGFNLKRLTFIAIVAIVAIAATYGFDTIKGNKESSNDGKTKEVVKDSDIVIPVKDITDTATFYPANINGIDLEVIAVKAPDGTIRTAFNTCQICYSSGKGYYEQEGDTLICQNCGNHFGMGDVEVAKGGCNPVPITSEYKKVDADTITISKDFLTEATVIFDHWKNGGK